MPSVVPQNSQASLAVSEVSETFLNRYLPSTCPNVVLCPPPWVPRLHHAETCSLIGQKPRNRRWCGIIKGWCVHLVSEGNTSACHTVSALECSMLFHSGSRGFILSNRCNVLFFPPVDLTQMAFLPQWSPPPLDPVLPISVLAAGGVVRGPSCLVRARVHMLAERRKDEWRYTAVHRQPREMVFDYAERKWDTMTGSRWLESKARCS